VPQRVVEGQQPVEMQHALGHRPAPLPEQVERGGEAQPVAEAFGVVLGLVPRELQGGPQVRVGLLQPVERLALPGPPTSWRAARATAR
jgi:hypothetical protein